MAFTLSIFNYCLAKNMVLTYLHDFGSHRIPIDMRVIPTSGGYWWLMGLMVVNDIYIYIHIPMIPPYEQWLMVVNGEWLLIFPGSDSWSALCRWQPLLAPAAPVDRGPQAADRERSGKPWGNRGETVGK